MNDKEILLLEKFSVFQSREYAEEEAIRMMQKARQDEREKINAKLYATDICGKCYQYWLDVKKELEQRQVKE